MVLGVHARATGEHVLFGAGASYDTTEGEHQRPRGGDERLVRSDQRFAHGGDRLEVCGDRAVEVAAGHPVVLEGEVDYTVGIAGGRPQDVEVVQGSALDRRAGRFNRRGGFI